MDFANTDTAIEASLSKYPSLPHTSSSVLHDPNDRCHPIRLITSPQLSCLSAGYVVHYSNLKSDERAVLIFYLYLSISLDTTTLLGWLFVQDFVIW